MNLTMGLLYFLGGCNSNLKEKEVVHFSMPIVNLDSSIEIYSSTFKVIKEDDMVLYELPFRESYYINDTILYDNIKYEFFIYEKGEKNGFLFRTLEDAKFQKVNVDSILNTRAFGNLSFDSTFSLKGIEYSKRKVSNEQFQIIYYEPLSGIDSIIVTFVKGKKETEFSFGPSLEAKFDAKIIKITGYQTKIDGYNFGRPMETSFEVLYETISKSDSYILFMDSAINRFFVQ